MRELISMRRVWAVASLPRGIYWKYFPWTDLFQEEKRRKSISLNSECKSVLQTRRNLTRHQREFSKLLTSNLLFQKRRIERAPTLGKLKDPRLILPLVRNLLEKWSKSSSLGKQLSTCCKGIVPAWSNLIRPKLQPSCSMILSPLRQETRRDRRNTNWPTTWGPLSPWL